MERVEYRYLGRMEYSEAWAEQKRLFEGLLEAKRTGGTAEQVLLFVEHPHVYTLGKSGHASNMLVDDAFLKQIGATYFQIDRGGDITYHGLGQLVGYPILDLERLGVVGLKDYIWSLEEAIIRTVGDYGIVADRLGAFHAVYRKSESPLTHTECFDFEGHNAPHFVLFIRLLPKKTRNSCYREKARPQ